MKDSYLKFTNGVFGARLTNMVGIPRPELLERYEPEKPVIKGSVLLGGGGDPALLETLATLFQSMKTQTLFHAQTPQWLKIANDAGLITGRWEVKGKHSEKVKALIFDATGISDSSESAVLHRFFHDSVRSILSCGRIIVLGRPPKQCQDARKATVQRGLEGLMIGQAWRRL